ncbi:hypothetical protein GIB67_021517 [Kingdonia uniflora]|uniref:Uncharacterized protein n=1 Tax=Kingdonia uniflora TaxID=39325 RepID=A0A7J7L9I8_9MAGN|nr:hypothetical protein GIB67_021517 [Kingdonia uniflora]
MFAALPEEENGALRATCFAPLLLIDLIVTMSTLVVEIFDHHLGDVLRLNLFKIILSYLLLNKGRNAWVKFVDLRNQNEAPAIGVVPVIELPAVGAPAIGSSSSATEIEAVVVRVCSQLEEHGKMLLKLDDHGKMLHNHGKMSEQILMSTVGDTLLLGQYQFSTPEKTVKQPRTKKGKGEWQKKAEEANVPNKKKKVEGLKKEAFIDDQFDHVPLIQLKTSIPKIPRKGLDNRVPRKIWMAFPELENIQSPAKNFLQQVVPEEGLEVANDLMVDNDVEVGREVNFNEISFEYGSDLLENGDEKVDDAEKDGEEKKSEEEQPQVAEEEDSEPPTLVVYYNEKKDETMVATEVTKTEIVFFNQEEVVGEVYQASADQITVVSVEEHTIKVAQTEVVISHQKEDVGEVSQLILMESEVDDTLKKRHVLTEEEINERAIKIGLSNEPIACSP